MKGGQIDTLQEKLPSKSPALLGLIRLDLMLSMSLCKEFQLLNILNDLSIKNLIRLILYENDAKHLEIKRKPT